MRKKKIFENNMLTIRLQRRGKKNQPFFKIIVTEEKKSSTRGRSVEELGYYNPLTKERSLNGERAKYWMSVGAQPSDTVYNMLITDSVIEGAKRSKHKKSKKEAAPEAEAIPAADTPAEAAAPSEEPVKAEEPAGENEAPEKEPKETPESESKEEPQPEPTPAKEEKKKEEPQPKTDEPAPEVKEEPKEETPEEK